MKEIRKVIIKTLIAVWCLSDGSLFVLQNGYAMDVPVVKYIFTILIALDGWGLEGLFTMLGIGTVFWLVKDRQKNPWITGLSAFFAICTVVGISYSKTASWDCLFLFGTQTIFAMVIAIGYYFLYKNSILFIGYIFKKKQKLLATETNNTFETLLFEKHPFVVPLIFITVMGIPWLVAFMPGTLQWDAHGQLLMAMGVVEKTSHHPVFMTNYMWGCISAGRNLFGSDSIGLLLYALPQYIAQSVVFSYVFVVMKKMNCPVLFRWIALIYWSVFPYFQIWGMTMVKDTPYYIAFVLFVTVIIEVLTEGKIYKKSYVLMGISTAIFSLARNDGRYVLVFSLLAIMLAYRKYWRIWLVGLVVCVTVLVVQEKVYMPANNIRKGAAGEMLSMPLQQTARYLSEHYDEVTEEEAAVLQEGFTVDISQIGDIYNPELSDPVKERFIYDPDEAYMKEYLGVWFSQFSKHPKTYIQATLNQIYGYFYPGYSNPRDGVVITAIGSSDHYEDGNVDIQFFVGNEWLRKCMRFVVYSVEKMPGISLLYGCGIYTYILLGAVIGLIANKKWKELVLLVPDLCILLICIVSPVNGYLRYMMPIMATMPLWGAWCYNATVSAKNERRDQNKVEEAA